MSGSEIRRYLLEVNFAILAVVGIGLARWMGWI